MKITLKRMTTDAYATADTFFRSKEVKDLTRDYFNYVYTSCLDYLDTGDVNILNRVIVSAGLVQRVRVTGQLVSLVAAHSKVGTKYKGKANQKRLKMLRGKQQELKGKQEAIINRDTETKEAKAKTFDPDQAQTRAVNAIAALLAHDVEVDVAELVKLAVIQKNKVTTKETVKGKTDSATPMSVDF